MEKGGGGEVTQAKDFYNPDRHNHFDLRLQYLPSKIVKLWNWNNGMYNILVWQF